MFFLYLWFYTIASGHARSQYGSVRAQSCDRKLTEQLRSAFSGPKMRNRYFVLDFVTAVSRYFTTAKAISTAVLALNPACSARNQGQRPGNSLKKTFLRTIFFVSRTLVENKCETRAWAVPAYWELPPQLLLILKMSSSTGTASKFCIPVPSSLTLCLVRPSSSDTTVRLPAECRVITQPRPDFARPRRMGNGCFVISSNEDHRQLSWKKSSQR